MKILKSIKVLLLKLPMVVLFKFFKITPRSKRIIVFGSENGKGFRGNPKYLFLKFNKSKFRLIWILKNKQAVKDMRIAGYECYSHTSIKGMYYQIRAKYLIHSHSIHDDFNKVLVSGATSINTWHGVGLKKVWGANKNTFSYKTIHEKNKWKKKIMSLVEKTNYAKTNYFFSTSPRVSSYYPETFSIKKEQIFELGQARNDVFFDDSLEDVTFPDYLKKQKIIVYMPTHRKFGTFDKPIEDVLDLEAIDYFCKQNNYLFIIKRHMYSSGTIDPVYENIKDISQLTIDPQQLLKYTDILITDYSSCYTDYLLLNRPVLFYCYDLDFYLKESNEMYFDYFEVTPGPKCKDFSSLMNSLHEVVYGIDNYDEERSRVLNIFYSKENQQPVIEKQLSFILNKIIR